MKLSVALSLLSSSLLVTAYAPTLRFPRPATRTSRLYYIDDKSSKTGTMDPVIDVGKILPIPHTVDNHDNDDDKLWMEALAFSLDLEDAELERNYHQWAIQHGKTMTAFRFQQWKRNFLMQEVWNRTNGEEFDLNEFGDRTNAEFEAITKQRVENAKNLEDVSHFAYWEEGEPSVIQKTQQQQHRFRQVMTFNGSFRMIHVDEQGNPANFETMNVMDPSLSHPTAVSMPPRPRQRLVEDQPQRKRGGFTRAGLLGDPAIR